MHTSSQSSSNVSRATYLHFLLSFHGDFMLGSPSDTVEELERMFALIPHPNYDDRSPSSSSISPAASPQSDTARTRSPLSTLYSRRAHSNTPPSRFSIAPSPTALRAVNLMDKLNDVHGAGRRLLTVTEEVVDTCALVEQAERADQELASPKSDRLVQQRRRELLEAGKAARMYLSSNGLDEEDFDSLAVEYGAARSELEGILAEFSGASPSSSQSICSNFF